MNKQVGLSHLCELKEMNYLQIKYDDNSFDKAFAIESTCHSGKRTDVFAEVFRVLKPGGLFASYEWVLTPDYDAKNPKHVKARQLIEKGNALPQLITGEAAENAMKEVGFGKKSLFLFCF